MLENPAQNKNPHSQPSGERKAYGDFQCTHSDEIIHGAHTAAEFYFLLFKPYVTLMKPDHFAGVQPTLPVTGTFILY